MTVGGVAPVTVNGEHRYTFAADWGNRNSRIDTQYGYYRPLLRNEQPRPGDVVGNGGHVGIVVGTPNNRRQGNNDGPAEEIRGNISASAADAQNGDRVKVNGYGFRQRDHPATVVVWRYQPLGNSCAGNRQVTGSRLC